MTDTPRTEEEILALFANNASHDISAQDLRDFVVSARPSPLYKRNWTGLVYKDNATSILTLPAAGATTFGTVVPFSWHSAKPATTSELTQGEDIVSGSYTLDGSDPANSYGVDIGVNTALMLEPGIWFWTAEAYCTTADAFTFPASSTVTVPYELFLDQTEYDVAFSGPSDGTIPWIYSTFGTTFVAPAVPRINAFPRGVDPGETRFVTYTGININDTESAKPFAFYAQLQPGWTTDMHLTSYFIRIVRIQ